MLVSEKISVSPAPQASSSPPVYNDGDDISDLVSKLSIADPSPPASSSIKPDDVSTVISQSKQTTTQQLLLEEKKIKAEILKCLGLSSEN